MSPSQGRENLHFEAEKTVCDAYFGNDLYFHVSERKSAREATEREKGNFCILSLKKTVSDAYFGQRLLEYDFLQIPRGKTITSSFGHAISDTFILIISERAPLGITYISMSPKVICEGAKRPSGGRVWEGGVPPPKAGKFLHLERAPCLFSMSSFGCIFWAKITRI